MTPIRFGSRKALLVTVALGGSGGSFVACTADSLEPITGDITVVVTTTGAGGDADGYTIGLDGRMARRVAQNERTAFTGLALGGHRVSISDVSPNCTVQGGEAITVLLSASDTATSEFAVECNSQIGELELRVMTTGMDSDPNGYTVTVDGIPRLPVDTGGVYRVTAEAGDRVVTLTGVTPNCAVTGDNPRTVRVAVGTVVATQFTVNCTEASLGGPGNEIYFAGPSAQIPSFSVGIHAMNADGTGRREVDGLQFNDEAEVLAWDPTGTRVALTVQSAGNQSITVALPDGTVLWRLESGFALGDGNVSWSPDGARLAFDAEEPACFTPRVMVVNADGTDVRQLTPACESDYGPAWSPDGRVAFLHEGQLVLVLPDGSDRRSIPLAPPNPHRLSWSPGGSRLAFVADIDVPGLVEKFESEIYTIRADGSDLRRLTGSPGTDETPSWSPDGSRIVFASERREGNSEIYVMDADGGHPERLTTALSFFESDGSPAWRP